MYKKGLSLLALSLLFFSCNTEKKWDFHTDYFSIGINNKGYITSMMNTTVSPNREFSPADIEGDAAPFQYIIHTPDAARFPLPDSLHEGQVFTLGGNGVSDVAFYANKAPYYRIMYGNAAMVDSLGRIFLNYQSRDRTKSRQVHYSLIPNMPANIPNHIDVEPIPGVDFIGSSIALWGSPDRANEGYLMYYIM